MMPIHWSIRLGLDDIFDILLQNNTKTQLNSRDEKGNTALIYTAIYNYFEGMKKLIDKGADLNILNGEKHSAAFISIMTNKDKNAALLIDNDASITNIDENGNNILHNMILHEWDVSILKIKQYEKIINKHPEMAFVKNNDGKTPIDLLTRGDRNHHNKRLINSFLKKVMGNQIDNDHSMSL